MYPSVKVDSHHIPLKHSKHFLYENLRLIGGDMLLTVVLLGWVFVLRQALYLAQAGLQFVTFLSESLGYRHGPIAPIT